MTTARWRTIAGAATLALLVGCSGAAEHAPAAPTSAPILTSEPVDVDLDLALSTPVEDSVYPQVGDPGVDALHYDLDLRWKPTKRQLTGTAVITFRATATARRFQFDFSRALTVTHARFDGKRVRTEQRGKNLVVRSPVEAESRHSLVVKYSGRPRPVRAPTTRSDFSQTGFTVTRTGEVWTMQEPYGAYSWYPVNDQPADKALYDFTIHTPAGWTGIANGALTSKRTRKQTTTTTWQLSEPASSYLITLAIGDFTHSSNTTRSGQRIDYWVPRGGTRTARRVRVAAPALDWLEERLGPYPFDTLGLVVTDSRSAMETQTMVTLGGTDYVLSPAVILHELAHQWTGDQVSPEDWRDVWMNEGITMLLQWLWEDEHGVPLASTLQRARAADRGLRNLHGPPGAYDPDEFGEGNIYHVPALMWNALRVKLGEEKFFAILRSWQTAHDNTSTTRDELYAHWEAESGLELTAFFDAWIMGETTPPRGVPGL